MVRRYELVRHSLSNELWSDCYVLFSPIIILRKFLEDWSVTVKQQKWSGKLTFLRPLTNHYIEKFLFIKPLFVLKTLSIIHPFNNWAQNNGIDKRIIMLDGCEKIFSKKVVYWIYGIFWSPMSIKHTTIYALVKCLFSWVKLILKCIIFLSSNYHFHIRIILFEGIEMDKFLII